MANHWDLIVVGGGFTGTAAAVAAVREEPPKTEAAATAADGASCGRAAPGRGSGRRARLGGMVSGARDTTVNSSGLWRSRPMERRTSVHPVSASATSAKPSSGPRPRERVERRAMEEAKESMVTFESRRLVVRPLVVGPRPL